MDLLSDDWILFYSIQILHPLLVKGSFLHLLTSICVNIYFLSLILNEIALAPKMFVTSFIIIIIKAKLSFGFALLSLDSLVTLAILFMGLMQLI